MDGLLSFLLFAVLFFVMMRFGCGAHMMHGTHDHKGGRNDADDKHVDPVCGKTVASDKGYGKMHDGNLLRFCSRDCLDKFETQPDEYTSRQIGGVT